MNTAKIGNALVELENKIYDEIGLGLTAKTEIMKAIDGLDLALQDFTRNAAITIGSLRNSLNIHFDERAAGLTATIEEPADQPAEQKHAA